MKYDFVDAKIIHICYIIANFTRSLILVEIQSSNFWIIQNFEEVQKVF